MLKSKVREYRLKAGLTQAQLAKESGVSLDTIRKYESSTIGNGQALPLYRLSAALDCTIQELIYEVKE